MAAQQQLFPGIAASTGGHTPELTTPAPHPKVPLGHGGPSSGLPSTLHLYVHFLESFCLVTVPEPPPGEGEACLIRAALDNV